MLAIHWGTQSMLRCFMLSLKNSTLWTIPLLMMEIKVERRVLLEVSEIHSVTSWSCVKTREIKGWLKWWEGESSSKTQYS